VWHNETSNSAARVRVLVVVPVEGAASMPVAAAVHAERTPPLILMEPYAVLLTTV
jgi:hypothetical protein